MSSFYSQSRNGFMFDYSNYLGHVDDSYAVSDLASEGHPGYGYDFEDAEVPDSQDMSELSSPRTEAMTSFSSSYGSNCFSPMTQLSSFNSQDSWLEHMSPTSYNLSFINMRQVVTDPFATTIDTSQPMYYPGSPLSGEPLTEEPLEIEEDNEAAVTPLPVPETGQKEVKHSKPVTIPRGRNKGKPGHQCFERHCSRNNPIFDRKADLQRHLLSVHNFGERVYLCPMEKDGEPCNRGTADNGFTRKDHLVEHLRTYHKQPIPKKYGGGKRTMSIDAGTVSEQGARDLRINMKRLAAMK